MFRLMKNTPYQGQSPYSATKIGADRLAESFYRSFDLPVVIVRPFNTYGPRQSARAVIPTIITQLLTGGGVTEIKLGNTNPTRDFNYVKDVSQAFCEIAKSEKVIGEEINIATGVEISISKLTAMLISMLNPDASILSQDERIRPEKSEVDRLLGSNEKLKSLTGWKPKYVLREGLEETVEWFKNPQNISMYKAWRYNI